MALEGVGGGLHHPLAGGHRPGDRHLGHARVRGQRGAGGPGALHHIEHARRQAGLGVDLGQLQRRHGGEFGGLEHHGVARRQRGRRLPAGDLDRVVPRADAGAHAQRLAPGVGEGVLQRNVRPIEGRGGAGKEVQAVGPAGHVHHQRLLQRLASVLYLQSGQFVVALHQQIGGAAQHLAAFGRGGLRPDLESPLRGGHGGVHILCAEGAAASDRPPGRGVDVVPDLGCSFTGGPVDKSCQFHGCAFFVES
jgi:hypothetical protein